jgi:hypothetical protein
MDGFVDVLLFVMVFMVSTAVTHFYLQYIDICHNYNFVCGSVWVRNSDSDINGGTKTEGVWEQGAEENIWT